MQKLESLFNIAGLLTKPQPLSLKYRQILDELTRVTRVEFASLRILDEDTQQLRLLAFSGPDGVEPPPDILPLQSPSGLALQEGRFKIEGAVSPEASSSQSSSTNSGTVCTIPLIGQRPLGVINVASTRAGHFTPDLVKLLTAIGEGLGALMENAHISDEREQLARQLVQSQKLETAGRLAAGVAHDFNNLLTLIMGHAYAGLSKLSDDSPPGTDLEEIEKAAGRAGELTQKLLAFSMRGEMEHQEVNVNELITGLEFMLGRLMGEDVEIDLSLEPDLDEVRADQGQLEQILVNLALNAKDAMPTGGTLTIQTGSSNLSTNDIGRRSGKLGERQVTISVTDTGTGMTQAVKERVFEPFFTTKADGSGMGLSTAYGVIKQGGGDIVVESEPGKGTSFTIYLPLLEQAAETSQTPRTTLDLLLTDVVMPRMDGRQLADRLSAKHAAIKVLYCSGYAYDSLGQHGVLESGAHILHKPFTPGPSQKGQRGLRPVDRNTSSSSLPDPGTSFLRLTAASSPLVALV